MVYEMKPAFEQRMRQLLSDVGDFEKYNSIVHKDVRNFIRCNTLKIDSDELFHRLNKKWKVTRPFHKHGEIMVIESELGPGELGKSIEHLLGYYYVQEVSSMMSILALEPKEDELVLDVAASPGSKTTQMAASMKNAGTLIANDVKLDRVIILNANLERCGVTNCVVTRNDGVGLCTRLAKAGMKFDKILLDAPCSGEGTLRSSPKTFLMWNPKMIGNFSRMQKKMLAHALKCLKKDGVLVYSTCTHAPEENEEVVDFALKNFPVEVEELKLPLNCRKGLLEWKDKVFDERVSKCSRIYPQDNDSEGFFVAKLKLKEEVE